MTSARLPWLSRSATWICACCVMVDVKNCRNIDADSDLIVRCLIRCIASSSAASAAPPLSLGSAVRACARAPSGESMGMSGSAASLRLGGMSGPPAPIASALCKRAQNALPGHWTFSKFNRDLDLGLSARLPTAVLSSQPFGEWAHRTN